VGRISLRSFSSLGVTDFRRLWLALLLANGGRWAFTLGISWFTYQATGSPQWVGAVVMGSQAPALLVAPLAGTWADRWSRRRLLVTGFALAAAASAGVMALAAQDSAPPLALLALSLLFGGAFSMQTTLSNTMAPSLVPPGHLVNAVSLQAMAFHGSQLLGSDLATPLLVTRGPQAIFGLCLALYSLAAWLGSRVQGGERRVEPAAAPALPELAEAGTMAFLRDGLRYVTRQPLLTALLSMVTLHCGLSMSYMGILPHFAARVLGGDRATYSSMMMAVGLGSVTGTMGLARGIRGSLQGVLYLLTGMASGLSLVAVASAGLVPWKIPWAMAMATSIGLSQAMFMALSQAWSVGTAPDPVRGRVASFFSMLATGAMAAGNWAFGAVAERWDPAAVMAGMGLAFAAVTAGLCRWWNPLQSVCSRGEQAVWQPSLAPAAAASAAAAGGRCPSLRPSVSTHEKLLPNRDWLTHEGV